jgi:PilZ domain
MPALTLGEAATHPVAASRPDVVPMTEPNRRKHTRFEIPVEVALTWSDGRATVITDDLGAGGCRLSMDHPPPENALVKVRIASGGRRDAAVGLARVAWIRPGTPAQFGLAFAPALVEAMLPLLKALVSSTRREPPTSPPAG